MDLDIRPLGLTITAKFPIVEEKRPNCCPDRTCLPIHVGWQTSEENLERGYSGSCWGYCGVHTFTFKQVEHNNDISHCIISPLKGIVRFFNCFSDLGNDSLELRRVLHILYPRECSECRDTDVHLDLTDYSLDLEDREYRRLCLGCAVRLGVAKFHPENIGTGRAVYY